MKVPELLSPVGDYDCLVAAVQNGADAVYFGSSLFNARASATNFDLNNIEKAIDYAKLRGVKTHLTLNTLIKEEEFEQAIELANKVYSYGIDAVIVQDLGLARFLIANFPKLQVHASTQMTFHNLSGILEAEKLGFSRVVLAREVPIAEIKKIREKTNIELEAFLHGALCISYSGQCLFSSMIGGRSGNRGRCAQACRLPYELLKDSKLIEKGYLLSPKDVSSLTILPELMDAGIDSFKIEGRMKTPEYVATVTRIYRKYIDSILEGNEHEVSCKDTTDLMQVFNRGGFSTGHLKNEPNSNFIYKEKSNNQGLYLGTVISYAPVTGHVKLKLEVPLSVGDTISISSESGNYTVSELMIKKQNFSTAEAGQIVTVGRMKGNIHFGDKIYKMSSKELISYAKQTFSGKEFKKIPLQAKLTVKKTQPVTLEIKSLFDDSPYYNIKLKLQSDIIPEVAVANPIAKERLIEQLSKTGNTPYEFKNIEIDLEPNLHIPSISKLNELRRQALDKINEKARSSYKRNELALTSPYVVSKGKASKPQIVVLLNHLSNEEDYSYLDKAYNVYIPFSCFLEMPYVVKPLCKKHNVFIYLPTIVQNKLEAKFKSDLNNIFNKFSLKGAVISNICQLDMVPNNLEKIANFTLNIFNKNTISELKNSGIARCTVSPELSKTTLIKLLSSSIIPSEVLVYGRLPLMTMQYCPLSHNNHCPENCPKMCKSSSYELKDRLDFRFKIEPDDTQTITTLYNSKITSIPYSDIPCDFVRISFLEESEEEKRKVIETILSGKRMEGENYTNGNLEREV